MRCVQETARSFPRGAVTGGDPCAWHTVGQEMVAAVWLGRWKDVGDAGGHRVFRRRDSGAGRDRREALGRQASSCKGPPTAELTVWTTLTTVHHLQPGTGTGAPGQGAASSGPGPPGTACAGPAAGQRGMPSALWPLPFRPCPDERRQNGKEQAWRIKFLPNDFQGPPLAGGTRGGAESTSSNLLLWAPLRGLT